LLVNSLYAVYEKAHEGFAERYLAMLAAGGTKHHAELLKPFGPLTPAIPAFWQGGLSVIEGMNRGARGIGVVADPVHVARIALWADDCDDRGCLTGRSQNTRAALRPPGRLRRLAAATRFMDPARTSPMAKTPRRLVSSARRSPGARSSLDRSKRTLWGRSRHAGSDANRCSVCPIKT